LSDVIYFCEGVRTIRIHTVCTKEKRAQKLRQVLARKSRLLGIFFAEGQYVQQFFGSVFEVLFFSGWVIQQYGLGTEIEEEIFGIVFG
jgi:hypothetical protein